MAMVAMGGVCTKYHTTYRLLCWKWSEAICCWCCHGDGSGGAHLYTHYGRTYKLCTPCEGHTGFHEPDLYCPERSEGNTRTARGFMKSSISRVYGVHNMFSAYHGTDSVFAQAAPRVLYPRHKFQKPSRLFRCIRSHKNGGSLEAIHTNGDYSPTRTHRSLNRMFSPC